MYYIEINGTEYPLRFGMGFVNNINKREAVPVEGMPGITQEVGLQWTMAKIWDGDLEALADVIFEANRTEEPRLTRDEIYKHFENDDTDVDKLFETIVGFLQTANCTRATAKKTEALWNQYREQNQEKLGQ